MGACLLLLLIAPANAFGRRALLAAAGANAFSATSASAGDYLKVSCTRDDDACLSAKRAGAKAAFENLKPLPLAEYKRLGATAISALRDPSVKISADEKPELRSSLFGDSYLTMQCESGDKACAAKRRERAVARDSQTSAAAP